MRNQQPPQREAVLLRPPHGNTWETNSPQLSGWAVLPFISTGNMTPTMISGGMQPSIDCCVSRSLAWRRDQSAWPDITGVCVPPLWHLCPSSAHTLQSGERDEQTSNTLTNRHTNKQTHRQQRVHRHGNRQQRVHIGTGTYKHWEGGGGRQNGLCWLCPDLAVAQLYEHKVWSSGVCDNQMICLVQQARMYCHHC